MLSSNSGCESGWTLYLDHSVYSSSSPSCFEIRNRSKDLWYQNCVHNQEQEDDEEEDDLSMISDASSGPRNVYAEDSVKKISNVGSKKQSKKENKRRDYEKLNSINLDDTASSHMLQKSVGGNKIEQKFQESTLDYSQGFSATDHFQDKTAFQEEQYGYLQNSFT